jgi:hypothetical protein
MKQLFLFIGNSMCPTMSFFGLVEIEVKTQYFINDIVSFIGKNHRGYCHRIVEIDTICFTTKGDNRNKSEEYEINVPIKNIDGSVKWKFP